MSFFAVIYGDDKKNRNSSVALIDPTMMVEHKIVPGDVILVIGQKTQAFTVQEDRVPMKNGIGVTEESLKWLGVKSGEKVAVKKVEPVQLKSLVIAPSTSRNPDVRRLSLEMRGRPLVRGQVLRTKEGEFTVISMEPKGEVGVITGETQIDVSPEVIRLTQKGIPYVTFDDIGGLTTQIDQLREIVEVSLVRPEVARLFGLRPPKGVLLYGPPGTGKTLIAKALANSVMANFFYISGPEIGSRYYGESEKRLREIFDQAEKSSPSIIFIDEIDAVAPNRDLTTGEADKRIVAQMLTLMDGVSASSGVLVIGATNRPNAVDPALRRPGRFDREVEIPIPGKGERLEVLKIHTRKIPMDEGVELEVIAEKTHGFVGADLEALVREAVMQAMKRSKEVESIRVTVEDFDYALKRVEPSALREFRIEIPAVTWEDIVGLDDVKAEIREVVEWPLKYPGFYEDARAEIPSGILLYGPPGTGKTMLGRAAAHESGANFISVNGPELMNMWVGETERAIREVFKRARQASPTIIFFDEIDAIATARGSDPNRVTDRALSQLLTEMDGVVKRRERVIVMAASNRPDVLDPALLRPGRLEKLVYVPPLDFGGRKALIDRLVSSHPNSGIDVEVMARLTEGYTPAEIRGAVNKAVLLSIRRAIKSNQKPVLTNEDLTEALKATRPSINQNVNSYYQGFTQRVKYGGPFS